jgi:hypothetical protein
VDQAEKKTKGKKTPKRGPGDSCGRWVWFDGEVGKGDDAFTRENRKMTADQEEGEGLSV